MPPRARTIYSTLFGLIVCATFITAWTLFVNHLVRSTQVNQEPGHWSALAGAQYDLCFDGCNDCLDVASIEAACRLTRKVDASGFICDARKIWFWEERYQEECLSAVGDIFRSEALQQKKYWRKSLHILSILGLALGFGAYVAMDKAITRFWPRIRAAYRQRRIIPRRRGSDSSTPLLRAAMVSLVAFSLASQVSAYPCMYQHPTYDQLFANADGTLHGVVHGWLSNCYDETFSCGESCATSAIDGKPNCSATECSRVRTDYAPADFVRAAMRRVLYCGFRRVDAVPGIVDRRIANPRIEGRLWVKVVVNRFNGSSGLEEQVQCLYDIVEAPRW